MTADVIGVFLVSVVLGWMLGPVLFEIVVGLVALLVFLVQEICCQVAAAWRRARR